MSEIELKFGVPDGAAAALDDALRKLGGRTVAIESHYWDSADRRLARAGLSLRLRKTAGQWEQTVKAAGESPVERLEETVPRPGPWEPADPAPELWLHAGTAVGARIDAALARRRGPVPTLQRAHSSIVERRAVRIEVDGSDVEVAFDRGSLVAGDRSEPLCEVEAELKHGEAAALIDIARASVDAHGMWLSTTAKSTRGDRLAHGDDTARAVKAKPAPLRADNGGPAIFRALIANCLDQVLANASVVAAGEGDDDVVHQLRIGLRRMRTVWRELRGWRGSLESGWVAPAADVFRTLGAYRDRRTIAVSMRQRLAAAGAPEPLLRPPALSPSEEPASVVRDRRFQHALLDILAFVLTPGEEPPSGSDKPELAIGRRLDKLHARLRRDAKSFEELDELQQHSVRRRLKRLRYLGEMVAPLYRSGRAGRFLAELEPAQDELGHYVDLVVAARLAHEAVAAGDPQAWFNVGWLKAQLPRAAERARKALRRAAEADAFW